SLHTAVMDLCGCTSTQSAYVMLSHVWTLEGIAILRPFTLRSIFQGPPSDLHKEFEWLDKLAAETAKRFPC
ncbi:hypothetical protein DACRYDRAFT_57353, partial [Dacryopinax primogenitus]